MTRAPSRQPFSTGIKALDAALTVGEGQRIGLFGPSASSITSMLGVLSHAGADVNAGNNDRGSITAFYTGLLEDEGEPIAAEARSLLDGHINLSRKPPTG